ncbi:VPLPA-CTERM sorting domain-containing protein [Oceanicoccus sp. KOV_DT_Chl]|uniref:VPLPA-CTERM sorting domain-containing protein n=1 Tax=Oceanicoccus sp. KOV_DT_Chl TaxID=1904639 RepID=UPI000C7DEA66|nr:VPLPA-CTERM sorting domain-containing protein [Oceanicoccus sp. KOV_DT_Chl]
MKIVMSVLTTILLAPAANATLAIANITGGGIFMGQTTSNTAWVQDNPYNGDEVNFWTLDGIAGQTLNITVDPINSNGYLLDAGISLYLGEVTELELLYSGFDHAGNFANNTLLATTNTFFPTAGNSASLLDILLTQNGVYTIAVGGEAGFSIGSTYDYTLNLSQVNEVPVPAAAWLFGSALLGLVGAGRKRA